jgi:hypothetical protein
MRKNSRDQHKEDLEEKMRIMANFFIDRILEKREKELQIKHQTATVSSRPTEQ